MSDNAVTVVCRAIADPAMQEKFRAVLPPDVSLDRFTRVTLTAIQNNPAILECDRQSLYNACVGAAQRGLLADGKEGALVSFNTKDGSGGWVKKAQFMPMVGGIIKEMAKAGIKAHAVSIYTNDEVEIWNDDTGQHFRHKPVVFGDRGERIGAVAWATDKEGRTYIEALNMDDITRIRMRSKQKDKDGNPTGTWRDSPDRMEQKSALHRLRNRMAVVVEYEDDPDYELDPAPVQQSEPILVSAADVAAAANEKPGSYEKRQSVAAKKRPRGLQAAMQETEDAETVPAGDDMPPDDGEVF